MESCILTHISASCIVPMDIYCVLAWRELQIKCICGYPQQIHRTSRFVCAQSCADCLGSVLHAMSATAISCALLTSTCTCCCEGHHLVHCRPLFYPCPLLLPRHHILCPHFTFYPPVEFSQVQPDSLLCITVVHGRATCKCSILHLALMCISQLW